MNKLQPIGADEQATLKTSISGKVAHVTFSVKPNGEKGTPRYNLTQIFDYGECTDEEILGLAVRSSRIDVQSMWRSAKDRMDGDVWQNRTWSVRSMLDEAPQKADPVKKTEKAFLALSIEDQAAFLKKHGIK